MNAASDEYRGLGWEHGCLTVQALGAMLAPITFVLPGGRQVSPMHIAPWAEEPASAALPGVLRGLRGDWLCAPFGSAAETTHFPEAWAKLMGPAEPDEELHGHCANHAWQWQDAPAGTLRLAIEYPEASPVSRIERSVTPDPSSPAVDIELRIAVRRDCRMPIGLHPTLRLPAGAGQAQIEPGRFAEGLTYPGLAEPSAPLFVSGARFDDLAAVPARSGGTIDASRLPLAHVTEELLQLNGIDGTAALANHAEGYRVRLSWQKEHFPSLLLWISNGGRKMEPWSGRHRAVGIEPICSPFGLALATALADNPIAASGTPTAQSFRQGADFVTRYRIAAELL